MTVLINLPAAASYAGVLRTTAAAMAARCDLSYDRLEDARLAIDEAFAQVVSYSQVDATIECAFSEAPNDLRFVLSGPTVLDTQLPTDSFSWTVLSALADELQAEVSDGRLSIHVRVKESQEVSV
ncbi:MAG: anti-sigma regulatory factor [Actinomycetota bacterium]|nr:anti-sigma regulatory factor [Actinomycetota bacterium]